jgi:hypothetical protein
LYIPISKKGLLRIDKGVVVEKLYVAQIENKNCGMYTDLLNTRSRLNWKLK